MEDTGIFKTTLTPSKNFLILSIKKNEKNSEIAFCKHEMFLDLQCELTNYMSHNNLFHSIIIFFMKNQESQWNI